MTDDVQTSPEFSRIFDVVGLEADGRRFRIEAEPAERRALSDRFGIKGIGRLEAEGEMIPAKNGDIRLVARIAGEATQSCVVTLEPVDQSISENIEIHFVRALAGEEEPDLYDEDGRDIEPLEGDTLDVGEIVAEEFALSLDPYPRKAGADTSELGPGAEAAGRRNPFEVLAGLKRKS